MAPYLVSLLIVANAIAAILFIASVLRRRKEPMAMLAWIFAIVFFPVFGMALYALIGSNRVHRSARRRRRRIAHLTARLRSWTEQRARAGERDFEAHLPDDLARIERMGRRLSQLPATGGNEIRVFQEADATYAALEDAISNATRHVHLEYYVWNNDETGTHFRDLLIDKARAGVECRLLLDAVGCWRLRKSFTRPLLDAGVRVAFFLPLRPFRKRWSPHLRNHRKIAVVDGRLAFTGSQNIGDEYRGRLKRLSPWYDTHVRIAGPAALFLQQTFAEDWLFATRENLRGESYFPNPQGVGESIVQMLPTGPDQDVAALGQIIFAAVSAAETSIRIATPYFVPDQALRMALLQACYRGVRVDLVLPTRSDSLTALWAGRSFYAELLQAGVQIHEFDGGVLHSKIITIDDRWCMVGSANMDIRSFRLNFEITALIYDPRVAGELSHSVERHCEAARAVTLHDALHRPLHQQLIEGGARLLAPLL